MTEINLDWLEGWIDALDNSDPAKAQLRTLLDYADDAAPISAAPSLPATERRGALEALGVLTRKAMGTLMDDRPEVPELKETVRQALSRTSDQVPEAVRRLPDRMRLVAREQHIGEDTRNYLDAFAHELDRAIAEQGGQPEHGESDE